MYIYTHRRTYIPAIYNIQLLQLATVVPLPWQLWQCWTNRRNRRCKQTGKQRRAVQCRFEWFSAEFKKKKCQIEELGLLGPEHSYAPPSRWHHWASSTSSYGGPGSYGSWTHRTLRCLGGLTETFPLLATTPHESWAPLLLDDVMTRKAAASRSFFV